MSDQASQTTVPTRDSDTERRILQAARTVFVRRGTAGARMQEIAEEAGVNQALLHYYFRSKEGLALAVFRETASRLLPSVVATLGAAIPLEEKIERFVHLYIDNVRQSPFIPGYLVSEMHHHPERIAALTREAWGRQPREIAGAALEGLREQLREGAAAGRFRPMAPEQFLVSLLALVVFPFVARPLLGAAFGMDDEAFGRFLDERRSTLPAFILGALRP